jgi:endonuclease G
MRLFTWIAAAAAAALTAAPASADENRLHTFHCLSACPAGAPDNSDIVVREIYTLAADPLTKLAVWVAYRVTKDTVGPSKDRNWSVDPWLAPEETLEEDDYKDSNAQLQVDRGHQAPLAAFSGTAFWADTNRLSNITPQANALNQGSWQQLEAQETKLAKSKNLAIYVLTGPLFERLMPALPKADERHRVPSGYWKVIMTQDGRMSAFIFDQGTPRNARYCDQRKSLDEVELRARLLLLPKRPTELASLDAEIGCD